jgi:hypothetical protein
MSATVGGTTTRRSLHHFYRYDRTPRNRRDMRAGLGARSREEEYCGAQRAGCQRRDLPWRGAGVWPPEGWPSYARYEGNSVRAFRERGCLCNPLIRDAPADRRVHAREARRRADRARRPRFAATGPADRSRHQNVLLKPLDATWANHADHPHHPAPTPPPTPARQPRRLLAHPGEMALVRPRLGLDRERDASRRSPPSRCPRAPASAASAAAATPPPEPAHAHAGPRPPSERPRCCAGRATASGERKARAQPPPAAARQRPLGPRRLR